MGRPPDVPETSRERGGLGCEPEIISGDTEQLILWSEASGLVWTKEAGACQKGHLGRFWMLRSDCAVCRWRSVNVGDALAGQLF